MGKDVSDSSKINTFTEPKATSGTDEANLISDTCMGHELGFLS